MEQKWNQKMCWKYTENRPRMDMNMRLRIDQKLWKQNKNGPNMDPKTVCFI